MRSRLNECLVNKSAGFTSPSIFLKSTRPDLTACWIHKVWVSKCRNLPKPWREQIPIDALESVQTRIGTSWPRSLRRLWYPSPIPAPLTTLLNSASPLLSATLLWVDQLLIV